jgi:NAD(P)-dependent dehydrogenase (short-subunit alcohol dehydrogenase family)
MVTTYKQKTVMITGAGGAVGRVVARYFAEQGARLVLVDRSKDILQSLMDDYKVPKARYLLASADLGKPAEVEKVIRAVERRYKTIDLLTHIAGGFTMGDPVHTAPLDVFTQMMYINAQVTYVTCGLVARHMVDKGVKGSIVAILAKAGQRGARKMGAYTASKAAAERIIQTMALELSEHNIRVNGIMPSTIDTPANRKDMPTADFNKWVTPQQIADVVAFLGSDAASAITGDSLEVFHKVL